ncbi:hypothetical protein VCR14J2_400149 [Vibrio coralliirubri]|nr:hypothetical protein VCR14J2_400149 [Vibrio coralliirubri]
MVFSMFFVLDLQIVMFSLGIYRLRFVADVFITLWLAKMRSEN